MKLLIFISGLFFTTSFSFISETPFPQTDTSSDFTWLTGTWEGEGFGGIMEESWSEPEDGTMMGMFRLHADGNIVFYEFMLLDENGIRLKHFNPDLTGWEEKDDMEEFQMISFTDRKIEMEGLVYELISDNEVKITLDMEDDGEISTVVFHLNKKE